MGDELARSSSSSELVGFPLPYHGHSVMASSHSRYHCSILHEVVSIKACVVDRRTYWRLYGNNFYVVLQGSCQGFIHKPRLRRTVSLAVAGADAGFDPFSHSDSAAIEHKDIDPEHAGAGVQSVLLPGANNIHRLHSFHSGQAFGEVSLMYSSTRGATVTASTDTVVAVLDRYAYQSLCDIGSMQLYRVFRRHATIQANEQWYMTIDQLLSTVGLTSRGADSAIQQRVARLLSTVLDTDLVNFSEFVFLDLTISSVDSALQILFRLVDKNRDGFVSKDELLHVLQLASSGADTAPEHTRAEVFGPGKSNTITYAEFEEAVSRRELPADLQQAVETFCNDLRSLYQHWRDREAAAPAAPAAPAAQQPPPHNDAFQFVDEALVRAKQSSLLPITPGLGVQVATTAFLAGATLAAFRRAGHSRHAPRAPGTGTGTGTGTRSFTWRAHTPRISNVAARVLRLAARFFRM